MHSRGFVRNGRSRTAVAIIVILIVVIFVISFHSTYKQLGERNRSYESCQSEQQELLARMQVVHDHKTKLEKSLEQGKLEHKKMREELISRAEEEKGQWQREKQELQNQYSSLKQQYNLLKNLNEELQSEFDQLTKNNNGLMEGKSQLEHAHQDALSQVSTLETDLQKCKDQFSDMEDQRSSSASLVQDLEKRNIYLKSQNMELVKEKKDLEAKLAVCTPGNTPLETADTKDPKAANHEEDKGVLPKPEEPYKEDKYKISSEGNPNPVAPIVPAPHVDVDSDVKNKQETVISKPGTNQDTKVSANEAPAQDARFQRDSHYSLQKPIIRHPIYPKARSQNSLLLERPNGIYQNPPRGFLPVPPGFDAGKYRAKGNSIRQGDYERRGPIVSNWNRPIYPHAAHKDPSVHQLEQPGLGLGKREVNDGENHVEEFDHNKEDYDFEQEQGEEGDADEDDKGNGYALDAPPRGNQPQFHDFRSNKRQGNGKNGFHYLEDGVMVQPK